MRHLQPELLTRFDTAFGLGGSDGPPQVLTPTELLIKTGQNLNGITVADPHTINLIRNTITKPWDEAWCVDFIQTCIAYVEARLGRPSPLPATEGVMDLWNRSAPYRILEPMAGDLILWQMGGTLNGHCGIITSIDSLTYSTIEGNTGPGAGIVRDGNGVYAKKRAKGGTKTFVELGFLRCFQ